MTNHPIPGRNIATLRVVIADDDPDARTLLQMELGRSDALTVVGVASDGREAVALAEQQRPDLVLLDLAMPVMDGFEAASRIRAALPECRIIALSAFPAREIADDARRAGADVFVEKADGDAALFGAIEHLFPAVNIAPPSAQNPGRAPLPAPHAERRDHTRQRRRADTRYRDLVDALPDVVVGMCDRDLRLQIVAGGGMDRVDLDARELIGRTLQDIMPEHQLGRIAAGYRAALNGRQVTLDDVESLRTATRWRTTFVPMRDEHGAITAAMAVARDVTDRAEAVAAARSGEQRLRAALLAMLDPFVLLAAVRDEDGKIVDFVFEYANRAAGVGRIAPESLIGRRLLGFLPKRAASVLFPRYVETVESGEPLELDGFVYEERANGRRTRRVFDVRAVPVENGLAYTWRDVTRRATLEQELMRAREEAARSFARLEAVVDAAPLAIAAVDAEDRISLWSAGAEQTFGWSKDEVLGRPIVILPEGEKAAYDERRVRELSGEPVLGLDGVRHHKDGHTFPVAVNTAPIRDDDGGLVETVVVIVDVTEQKNAERRLLDALERARRTSESKQALMRALAHDVGNPLTVIQGFAHMLEERSDRFDDDQKRMLIGRIRAQAERLLALTSDLLEAERLDDTELTRVETELSQLVIETVAEVDHDGHPVTVDATPVIARIDRVRVRRIVENLVVNAVRHTPAGTRVWVRVERNGDDVLLSVDDAGPGVDPSRRDHLFAAFERGSSSGGAGVGLSLVRRFTLDHGGHAWMEDRPGGGASFKVVLPAV